MRTKNYCKKGGNRNTRQQPGDKSWMKRRTCLRQVEHIRGHLWHRYSVTISSYGFYISQLICDTRAYNVYSHFISSHCLSYDVYHGVQRCHISPRVEGWDNSTNSPPPLLIRNDRHDITEILFKVALNTHTYTMITNASTKSGSKRNVYVWCLFIFIFGV